MISSKIVAYGKYLPKNIVTNFDLSNSLDTSDEWISTRTGIKERRISDENTSMLCTNASNNLMQKFNINPLCIDLIIVATSTGDYSMPSVACIVQKEIGAKNAFAFDISAACSGFIYALSVADKYLKSGMYKNVLVIGGEAMSKLIDKKDRGTAILFGDGCGCVLLQNSTSVGIIDENIKSDGSNYDKLKANYTGVNNFNEIEKDSRFLKMDGRAIFNFATKEVSKNIMELLKKNSLNIDDIKYIVPHQANIRITEIISKKLKCRVDKLYTNVQKFGNTSAASIPIALCEMFENNLVKLNSNDKIVLCGFGAGLTWGSILINL